MELGGKWSAVKAWRQYSGDSEFRRRAPVRRRAAMADAKHRCGGVGYVAATERGWRRRAVSAGASKESDGVLVGVELGFYSDIFFLKPFSNWILN